MLNLGTPITGRLLRSTALAGKYAVQYLTPTITADFARDKYRGGGANTFDEMFDYTSENSTATMVDSDGKMKWAPHNFLKQSVLIASGSYWDHNTATLVTGYTDPFGGTEASLLKNNSTDARDKPRFYNDRLNLNDIPAINWADSFTFSIYAKASGVDWFKLRHANSSVFNGVFFNVTTGTVGTADSGYTGTIVDCGDGWYKCSITTDTRYDFVGAILAPSDNDITWDAGEAVDGEGIIFYGPHYHVSSLGGMVGLPDVANDNFKSYVKTGTSTPTSEPRRNHHAYNGYSWVNQGILIESKDQRTNLIYPSNEIDTSGDWSQSGTTRTANSYTGPDGELSLIKVTANTNNASHHLAWTYTSTDDPMTASCFGRAIDGSTINHFGIRFHEASNNNAAVYFSLEDGVVTKVLEGSSFGGTIHNYGVEDWGGGLFRFWVTVGGITGTQLRFIMAPDGDPSNDSGYVAASLTSEFAGANNDTTAIALGFFQLEKTEASGDIPYPSSYLPTIAGTVSRGEETLAVAWEKLGPYPHAELTGSNIVSSDPDDWTVAASSNSITAAGNGFDVVNDGEILTQVNQSITTVNDKLYEFSFRITDTVSGNVNAQCSASAFNGELGSVTVASSDVEQYQDSVVKVYFTSTGTTSHVNLLLLGATGGIRDIQCKEVTSVGFAADIKGTFSYHDNDATFENIFLARDATDSDARAVLWNNTASSATGRIYARTNSDESGTAISGTSDTYFSSGSNIPMSFSGVFGYKAVSVAVDGSGKTVDTGDLIFPNVLYDDLDLFESADGTISQVRYFRNAPPDFIKSWGAEATLPLEEPSMSLTFEAVDDRSFVDTGWRVY